MILAFDTETTGKAEFKLPASHIAQPRLVQLGAILYDDDWKVRAEINLIVKPNDWTIPKEVSDIHGITQEIAEKCGLPHRAVIRVFLGLAKQATLFIAHNIQFDELVMDAALCLEKAECLSIGTKDRFCTMKAMTPICQLPGKFGDFKWPRLQEAYKHAFGEEFEGAHDAMADVRACARIYRWLKERDENERKALDAKQDAL
jgi:DNA polymerase-3 subunit epsilon